MQTDDATPWLVIDASHRGELRVTHVHPQTPTAVAEVRRYDAASLPTFADGLLRYQRDADLSLHGMRSVLAIAGATSGAKLQIARSRWTISRTGVAAILGHAPVIINEVAAQAWATRPPYRLTMPLRGIGSPDPAVPGCYAFISLADGVGAASIHVDERGDSYIAESEAGHMDFSPRDDLEEAIGRTAHRGRGCASWEEVLKLDIATVTTLMGGDKTGALRRRAAVLGRFTANVVLAFGAWRGALLTGSSVAQIATQGLSDAFDAAFIDRDNFRRVMGTVPCWRIDQREAVIMGCVALIAQQRSAH